jgi:hypothetical protein
LKGALTGLEGHRARDDAVQLLDPLSKLLRMPDLFLDLLLEVLGHLSGPNSVGVDRAGDVIHHRLHLHPVRRSEQIQQPLALTIVTNEAVQDASVSFFGARWAAE